MKRKLVIVEGGIASGKSSLSYLLRENMKHTTMISLSSIYDDTSVNNFLYHTNILNMLQDVDGSNFILCRSFLSNEIMSRLGHKSYNNKQNYDWLLDKLKFLNTYYYDVKIIILATTKQEFERRLSKRDKFELIEHTVNEALSQQREYLKIADELRELGFDVVVYNNSGMSKKDLCKLIMVEQDLE
jgi:deoxyadenosine/deoxycytidine kinase